MNKLLTRAVAGAGATVLLLALVASPSGAQTEVEVTGDFECQSDGTYLVSFTITNNVTFELSVDDAEFGGAIPLQPTTVTPNPIPADGTGTASITVPGDTDGLIDLTFDWTWDDGSGNESASVELAGDCEAAGTTTTTSTTAAPTTETTEGPTSTTEPEPAPPAPPVAVAPTFTG
jgi:hypothetical protein